MEAGLEAREQGKRGQRGPHGISSFQLCVCHVSWLQCWGRERVTLIKGMAFLISANVIDFQISVKSLN
jgi:hypothetical protein